MSSAFRLEVDEGRLATLTFDLPDKKANIFNRSVIAELEGLVEALAQRDDIGCLVLLSGKDDIFIAGADVDEITRVTDPQEAEAGSRVGQRLFSAWEALPFPTVAAVRGTCLGGGTELSLASTHILVSDRPGLRLGLPEVRLGILPGWGGCTRLPRRIGIAAALDLILTGKTIDGRKAFKLGLADALLPDASFAHQVRDFARAHTGRRRAAPRKAAFRELLLERNPLGRRLLFDQARKRTLGQTHGHYPAPLRAIEVVRVGVERGAEAGFDAEARAVAELAVSPVAKNLLHLFHLMEGAKRNGHLQAEPRPVHQVAVLGAGVMGGGIAHLVADKAGLPVRLKDISVESLASGIAHAAGLFAKQVRRRRLRRPEAATRLALVRPTLDYSGFARAELMIEAIVENLEVKQKVFAETARAMSETAILASNTSSLSIDLIGRDTPHPERVVGMHFFNPVDRMPLIEVIAGRRTSPTAVATIVELARKLGKTPVVVKDSPGFLVNRLLMFYLNEALWLLAEGHSIEELDRAMTGWGMPMGPLALTDEVGIDVAVKVAHILASAFSDRIVLPELAERMVDPKRLGAKTGSGFYRYEKGQRQAPDRAVYGLLGLAEPGNRGAEPGRLVDRMVLPMVNEAARCLEERVVASPGELDLAMIMGTGFPPFRGGLCRWADEQGLGQVVDELAELARSVGPRLAPSPALRAAAAAGGFYAFAWEGSPLPAS